MAFLMDADLSTQYIFVFRNVIVVIFKKNLAVGYNDLNSLNATKPVKYSIGSYIVSTVKGFYTSSILLY